MCVLLCLEVPRCVAGSNYLCGCIITSLVVVIVQFLSIDYYKNINSPTHSTECGLL